MKISELTEGRRGTLAFVAIVAAGTILMGARSAFGVILDASSIVAVRHLVPPEVEEDINRRYQAGGISGAGDVFGTVNSVRGHQPDYDEHLEDPLVWKRSDGYEGKVVLGGLPYFVTPDRSTPSFAFNAPSELLGDLDSGVVTDAIREEWANQGLSLADNATVNVTEAGSKWSIDEPPDPPGCRNSSNPCHEGLYVISKEGDQLEVSDRSPTKPKGAHAGLAKGRSQVNEDGYVAGNWNVDNSNAFFYDINTDKFTDMHGGKGWGVNSNRIVISPFESSSEYRPNYIASPDAVTEENPSGWIHVFTPQVMMLVAINNANIVVGQHEDNPIRMMPTGVASVAGAEGIEFPTYDDFNPETDVMEELGPAFSASRAIALSSSDPPYAVGISFSFASFGNAGVVWDAVSGSIIQTLGSNREPAGITEDGTIIYGKISDIFSGTVELALWMTNDGWDTFTELTLDDLLADLKNAGVPGAELIDEFGGAIGERCCYVAGVNNAGQIVAQGWPAGTRILNPAPGAVYLLDTLELGGGVIKGDVNNDGVVDFIDITPFINAQSAEGGEEAFLLLTPNGCFLCADIDMDGAIDFLDITPFVNLLDEIGAAAVPEPASALLFVLGLVAWRRGRRR